MAKAAKSIKYYRSDINSFETEGANKFYLFQEKEFNPESQIVFECEYRANGLKEVETRYEYDESKNLTSKQTFYILEETDEKLLHFYNEKGQKIRDENYFGDDLFEKVMYSYDLNGRLIAFTRIDEDENEIEKNETQFSHDGKIIKQSFFSNGELEREVEFEYNDKGECIKERHVNIFENIRETIEYAYNESGKKISSTTLNDENNIIGYIDVEYDEKMNPVKYTSETSGFYNSNAINQVTYDEKNRVSENEYFDVLNNYLMSKEKTTYDAEGNVAEQEIYEINPQAGMKKTHYRLQLKYIFLVD